MSPGTERDLIKLLKELSHDVKVLKENSKTTGDAVVKIKNDLTEMKRGNYDDRSKRSESC